MYGSEMGALVIYIKNETGTHLLVSKAGNRGESWHKIHIDIRVVTAFLLGLVGCSNESYLIVIRIP